LTRSVHRPVGVYLQARLLVGLAVRSGTSLTSGRLLQYWMPYKLRAIPGNHNRHSNSFLSKVVSQFLNNIFLFIFTSISARALCIGHCASTPEIVSIFNSNYCKDPSVHQGRGYEATSIASRTRNASSTFIFGLHHL
jgi:hypothetical protein